MTCAQTSTNELIMDQLTEHPDVQHLYRRPIVVAFLGLALLGLIGCTSHSPLRPVEAVNPNSGWLEISGPTVADLGSGIRLEMPLGPYRARFADAQGVFYQASLPLIYRTTLGTTTYATGGLYVLDSEPGQARAWSEPVSPSPSVAYSHWFPVRVFAAR
jgi:hypothetical protein